MANDRFGMAVAGVTDFDNAGIRDIAVGAPGWDNDRGKVYVLSLDQPFVTLSTATGEAEGDAYGSNLSGIGDANGNEYDDMIVGAPLYDDGANENAGRAYVFDGCSCPFQADYDEDGFLTALDLVPMINIIWLGEPDIQDPCCPTTRTDFNGNGFPEALDFPGLVDHLFYGGDPPVDPCAP